MLFQMVIYFGGPNGIYVYMIKISLSCS